MRRRLFVVSAATAALPSLARGRSLPRVGVIWHAGSAEQEGDYLAVFTQALAALGYVDGRTISLTHYFPDEQADRFRQAARELVDAKVDVIVAVTLQGAREARLATTTIPIVVIFAPDPVRAGMIQSLARPGGNLTGLSLMVTDQTSKHLSLMKEAVPALRRVGVLIDPTMPAGDRLIASYDAAAQPLGLALRSISVQTPDDIDREVQALAREGADGVMFTPSSMFFNERARIGAVVLQARLPAFVNVAEMVPFGPLMSYGQDFPDYFRRAAAYVDRILKGATPADLPVEQPTRLTLALNLKTAKALGLVLSPSLLAAADTVIE